MKDSTRCQASRTAQQTILVVDDNQPFRERLAQALADRGYRVWTADSYDQAIAVAGERPLDRAIVDLRMPGRGGLEVLQELLSLQPAIRVLVLSGFGSIASAVEAVKRGAIDFLPKPADADDILSAFRRAEGSQNSAAGQTPMPRAPSLARAEWEHIHRVLADCDGNISEAARRLGIHRRSLQRKLQKRAPE